MSNINRKFFYDTVRLDLFGGRLKQSQVDGLTVFLDYWEDHHAKKDDRWLAYALATAHLEVDQRFQPIKEYGSKKYFFDMYDPHGKRPWVAKDLGNTQPGDGVQFHGRGFVQLTGRRNYTYWEDRLGVDLTSDYDASNRVLDTDMATTILFDGMMIGSFTGKKLSDYFNPNEEDWKNARRIINHLDKADVIAEFGRQFYKAISYTTA
jgi:hypothetical protein